MLLHDLSNECLFRISEYVDGAVGPLFMTLSKPLIAKLSRLPLKVDIYSMHDTFTLGMCQNAISLKVYGVKLIDKPNLPSTLTELSISSRNMKLIDYLPPTIEQIRICVDHMEEAELLWTEKATKKLPNSLLSLGIIFYRTTVTAENGQSRLVKMHLPPNLTELNMHGGLISNLERGLDATTHPLLTKLSIGVMTREEQQLLPTTITELNTQHFGPIDDLAHLPLTRLSIGCHPILKNSALFPHLTRLIVHGTQNVNYDFHLPHQLEHFSYNGSRVGTIDWGGCSMDTVHWRGDPTVVVPTGVYKNAKNVALPICGDLIGAIGAVSTDVEMMSLESDMMCVYDFSRFGKCFFLQVDNIIPTALPKYLTELFICLENLLQFNLNLADLTLPWTLRTLSATSCIFSVKQLQSLQMLDICSCLLTDEFISNISGFDHRGDNLEMHLYSADDTLIARTLSSTSKPKAFVVLEKPGGNWQVWE